MTDRQMIIASLNGRIALLEEDNARLREELQAMTTRMQKFEDTKIDYSDRLIKVLTL